MILIKDDDQGNNNQDDNGDDDDDDDNGYDDDDDQTASEVQRSALGEMMGRLCSHCDHRHLLLNGTLR